MTKHLIASKQYDEMMWSPTLRSRFSAMFRSRSLHGLPAYWHVANVNVGDAISPIILEHYLQRPIGWVSKTASGKIISTGSLVLRVREGDLILGSGLLEDCSISLPRGAVAMSVRGPMTRERLGQARVPEVYGDPGLLIPKVTGLGPLPGDAIGVIPHFIDKAAVEDARLPENAVIIDVQAPWRHVVDQIRRCRAVVSSSLHGLIIAEAFDVPAVWISISDNVIGAQFKFNDYYLGTGRQAKHPVSLPAGLEMATSRDLSSPHVDSTPIEESFVAARQEMTG